MTLSHESLGGALHAPRGKEHLAGLDTALNVPIYGAQGLHCHADFALSGFEADSSAPNLDHPPYEILDQELKDRKDLPLSVFPSAPGFQSGSVN